MAQSGQPASPTPAALSFGSGGGPLSSFNPILQALSSGNPVNPQSVPGVSGPDAGLWNTLLAGGSFAAGQSAAQGQALQSEAFTSAVQAGQAVQQQQAAANLQLQGIGLSAQQIAIQQRMARQQAALNPQLQSVQQQQFNIQQGLQTGLYQGSTGANFDQAQFNKDQSSGMSPDQLVAKYGLNPYLQQLEQQQYSSQQQQMSSNIGELTTQQQAEVAGYGQQWDPNDPNSMYSLSKTGLSEQLANIQAQHQFALPQLASSAAASGALNSGQAKLNTSQEAQQYGYAQQQNTLQGQQLEQQRQEAATQQAAEVSAYQNQLSNLQAQQLQAQLGQKGETAQYQQQQKAGKAGLKSAALGQKAEQKQYQYSQKQIQAQEQGLAIAQRQTGLSKEQTKQSIAQFAAATNTSQQQVQAQIALAFQQNKGQFVNNLINSIMQAGIASGQWKKVAPAKGKK